MKSNSSLSEKQSSEPIANDVAVETKIQEADDLPFTELRLDEYTPKKATLKVALLAIFTALGPALSISFIWFPYFELMTLTIFIAGIVLGFLYGSAVALLSATLYEIISMVAIGPGFVVFPFKLIVYLLIALIGAFIGKTTPTKTTYFWRFFLGVTGGLLTVLYDLVVNIGMVLFLELTFTSYFIVLLTGLPVTAAKVGVNITLFAFIPDILNRALSPLLLRVEG
ncbi:MAG: hypothetical protein HZR80_01710 [Candidatus Heimdallarchaeota archaeon]